MFERRHRRREQELAKQEDFRTVRRFMRQEIIALGEDLAELRVGIAGADAGHEVQHHCEQAIAYHDKAKHLLAVSTTTEEVIAVEQVLIDARWHHASVRALCDGEQVPQPGTPCYFDARHGPSTTSVAWSPQAGAELTVAVCAADARRLTSGEAPETRMVRVEDRYMPWHEIGDLAGLLRHARELREAASLNTGHHSHLTSHPSFDGAEGLS